MRNARRISPHIGILCGNRLVPKCGLREPKNRFPVFVAAIMSLLSSLVKRKSKERLGWCQSRSPEKGVSKMS